MEFRTKKVVEGFDFTEEEILKIKQVISIIDEIADDMQESGYKIISPSELFGSFNHDDMFDVSAVLETIIDTNTIFEIDD